LYGLSLSLFEGEVIFILTQLTEWAGRKSNTNCPANFTQDFPTKAYIQYFAQLYGYFTFEQIYQKCNQSNIG